MFQAIVKKGKVIGENVPVPIVSDGSVLIKVMYSCISAGTEVSGVKASSKSLIKKALEQPENVKKILNMVKSEGIEKAIARIKGKLDVGSPTGYSLSGVVLGIGNKITDLKVGNKVACAGGGVANHAEYVEVPRNLIVKMPDNLGFKEASTVALGSIAMQGVRRTDVGLGEYIVVLGLGIMGQLTLQMLKNAGCRVIGIDLDERRLNIARKNGADLVLNAKNEDIVKNVFHFTDGYGADAVIFTAATDSPKPLSQAFGMCRKKGKVILVGVSGMEIKRGDIYPKELDFLISTSYGPGRYDEDYEKKGYNYPYAYVRWTENRNMQEYLKELSEGKIKLINLIEKVYPMQDVTIAFEVLQKPERPLIVTLEYSKNIPENLKDLYKRESRISLSVSKITKKNDIINVALVGAGSFATGIHLPNLMKLKDKYNVHVVMSKTSYKAKTIAKQYGASCVTTDFDAILEDKNVDIILICTRHNLHADYTLRALKAGKNVFVEKPLCTTQEELSKIKTFYESTINSTVDHRLTSSPNSGLLTMNYRLPLLMVGFNRRFSKYAQEAKKHTSKRINPLFMRYRMNAGYIPLNHWVHTEEGGGRIIGEACHIIDLFTYFTEGRIETISVDTLTPKTKSISPRDNVVITLTYGDGSIATLEYFAVGSREFPKEYMEIHFDQKTILIDDYKRLKGYGLKISGIKTNTSEKGHLEELEALSNALSPMNHQSSTVYYPIELWDIFQTTEMSLEVEKLIRQA